MLKESLEKFEQAEKELVDVVKHEAFDGIETMDVNTMLAIQSVFKFMEATTELIKQQTLAIDEMNRKIDELMKKR